MNILWLSHIVPYPPVAGNVRRSFNLIQRLAKHHTIYLLAFNQKALLPNRDQVESSKRVLSDICEQVSIFDLPTERYPISFVWLHLTNLLRSIPYSVQATRSTPFRRALEELLAGQRIDVVHCDTIELAQYFRDAHTQPWYLNHHNIESQLLGRRAEAANNLFVKVYAKWQAAKLRRYEKRMAPRFRCNFAVSDNDMSTLLEVSPSSRVFVVPNGADTDYFRPSTEPEERNRIVFVGSLNWFPNRDAVGFFTHEVLPLVRKQVPEAHFVIVGSGADDFARRHSTINVKSTGVLADIRPELHLASIIVVPIRIGGGTRLKILEAFSCGKTVVSTRAGCEGLAVTNERDILIADTAEGFAQQVIRALNDATLRHSLGTFARELVEKRYSWAQIVESFESTLETM